MKFFHLSDLHIGKTLHNYSLLEEQKKVFDQVIQYVESELPDAVLITGDIYDRSVPSAEAVSLFDDFLNRFAELKHPVLVLIIAGNHDNPERLNYASSFLNRHHIHIAALPPSKKDEPLYKVELSDEFGTVNFYLLPFIKPGYIRHLFEEGEITTYESAVQALINKEQIDTTKRNVLLSHQFYVNGTILPECSDSEQVGFQVGGLDSVDVSVIESFDYAALGHIHKAQSIRHPYIRYCGTPLKYSVSECNQEKSITVVTLNDKESAPIITLLPLHTNCDVRKEKGTLQEVLSRANQENCHDYVSVTLTDEEECYRPKDALEEKYDHILEIIIDNARTRAKIENIEGETTSLDPLEAFMNFYQEMQQQPMTQVEQDIIKDVFHKVLGGE